jgi:outer membrane protein assembly factor BamB
MKFAALAGCLGLVWTVTALAGDWTQFRGPAGAGVLEEAGLPVRWSATEGIRWKADLPGRGLSNPVIAAGRVFVTACSGAQQERLHVVCFEAATGRRLWERQLWATGSTQCHAKTCMAAPTPVTDGHAVYALFATADLAAFDRDGNLLWYRSLVEDYPRVGNNVGLAASPVLWKEVLIVPLDNAGESFAAGIDTRTGRNRWRVERPRGINWITPAVFSCAGRPAVLFQSGKEATAYDPQTGERLWTHEATGLSTIPSPVAANGLVLVPGSQLLALRPSADRARVEVAWKSSKLTSSYATPVVYGDRVYAVNNTGVVNAVRLTDGKLVWQSERLKGPFAASPVIGDGKMYLVNEEGTTTVLRLGAKPEVSAINPLQEPILSTPAIAGGALFLRSDGHLFCIGAPAKVPGTGLLR